MVLSIAYRPHPAGLLCALSLLCSRLALPLNMEALAHTRRAPRAARAAPLLWVERRRVGVTESLKLIGLPLQHARVHVRVHRSLGGELRVKVGRVRDGADVRLVQRRVLLVVDQVEVEGDEEGLRL